MHVIMGVSLYSHCVETKKLRDPPLVQTLQFRMLIMAIVFTWGS